MTGSPNSADALVEELKEQLKAKARVDQYLPTSYDRELLRKAGGNGPRIVYYFQVEDRSDDNTKDDLGNRTRCGTALLLFVTDSWSEKSKWTVLKDKKLPTARRFVKKRLTELAPIYTGEFLVFQSDGGYPSHIQMRRAFGVWDENGPREIGPRPDGLGFNEVFEVKPLRCPYEGIVKNCKRFFLPKQIGSKCCSNAACRKRLSLEGLSKRRKTKPSIMDGMEPIEDWIERIHGIKIQKGQK